MRGKLSRMWRSSISLMLVFCMLISMAPAAFATDSSSEQTTIKYVSLGDSVSLGNGSYPNLFESWLVEEGYADKVEHSALAMDAMRAEDLHFILTYSGANSAVAEGEWNEAAWNNAFSAGDYYTWKNFTSNGIITAEVAKQYQTAVAAADLLTVGIGNANFGDFLMDCAMDAVNGELAWVDVENAMDGIDGTMKDKLVALYKDELLPALEAKFGNEMAVSLANAITYTLVGYAVNYKGVLDQIVALNDDAEVIIVPVINTMDGIAITYADTTYNFGDYMENGLTILNAYLAALPAAMQAAGKYPNAVFYYAEVGEVELQGNTDAVLTREAILETVVGENGDGLLWGLLAEQASGVYEGAELVTITKDDVDKYEAMTAEERVDFVAQFDENGELDMTNASMAISVSLYLALEKAIIDSKGEVLTIEGLEQLSDLSGIMNEVMTTFETELETAGEKYEKDAYGAVAELVNDELTKKLAEMEIAYDAKLTADDIETMMVDGDECDALLYDLAFDIAAVAVNDKLVKDYGLTEADKLTAADIEALYNGDQEKLDELTYKLIETTVQKDYAEDEDLGDYVSYLTVDLIEGLYKDTLIIKAKACELVAEALNDELDTNLTAAQFQQLAKAREDYTTEDEALLKSLSIDVAWAAAANEAGMSVEEFKKALDYTEEETYQLIADKIAEEYPEYADIMTANDVKELYKGTVSVEDKAYELAAKESGESIEKIKQLINAVEDIDYYELVAEELNKELEAADQVTAEDLKKIADADTNEEIYALIADELNEGKALADQVTAEDVKKLAEKDIYTLIAEEKGEDVQTIKDLEVASSDADYYALIAKEMNDGTTASDLIDLAAAQTDADFYALIAEEENKDVNDLIDLANATTDEARYELIAKEMDDGTTAADLINLANKSIYELAAEEMTEATGITWSATDIETAYDSGDETVKAYVDDANDAKKELADALEELGDAQADLAKALVELEDAKADLADALVELDDAKADLADALVELRDTQTELLDAIADLEEAKQELADALVELKDAQKQLTDGLVEIKELQQEAKDGLATAIDYLEELKTQTGNVFKAQDEFEDKLAKEIDKVKDEFYEQINDGVNTVVNALTDVQNELKTQIPEKQKDAKDTIVKSVDEVVDTLKTDVLPVLRDSTGYVGQLLGVSEALSNALTSNDMMKGVLSLFARCLIGDGLGFLPTTDGHKTIAEAVEKAYKDKHTVQDETKENVDLALDKVIDVLEENGMLIIDEAMIKAGAEKAYEYITNLDAAATALKAALEGKITEYQTNLIPAIIDDLEDLEVVLGALEAKLAALEAKLDSLKKQLDEIEKMPDAAVSTVEALEKAISETKDAIAETKEKIATINDAIDSLEAQLEQLLVTLNELKSAVEQMDTAILNLYNAVKTKDISVKEAIANLKAARDGAITAVNTVEKLYNQLKELAKDIIKGIDLVKEEAVAVVAVVGGALYVAYKLLPESVEAKVKADAEAKIADLEKQIAAKKAEMAAAADAALKAQIQKQIDTLEAEILEIKTQTEKDIADLGANPDVIEILEYTLKDTSAAIYGEYEDVTGAFKIDVDTKNAVIDESVQSINDLLAFAEDEIDKIIADAKAIYVDVTTDTYTIYKDSLYVALGDESAKSTSYVDMLAADAQLKMEDAYENAYDNRTIDQMLSDIIGGDSSAVVEEADLITIRFDNSQIVKNAFIHAFTYMKGAEVYAFNWADLIGEKGVDDVEAFLADLEAKLVDRGMRDMQLIDGLPADGCTLDKALVHMAEAYLYYSVKYLYSIPDYLVEIRELNPDATVVFVGMSNPFGETVLTHENLNIEIGSYVDTIIDYVDMIGVAYCMLFPNATYVSAKDVETQVTDVELDLTKFFMSYIQDQYTTLYPTATGHEYIKNQILKALTIIDLRNCEHVAGEPVEENRVEATCSVAGSYDQVIYCTICGEEMNRETVTIPATGVHVDEDGDNYCDECGKVMGLWGDADSNGVVNNIDALLILHYEVGNIGADRLDLSVCDVSNDGVVNNIDALLILHYEVGNITIFPVEKN